MIINQSGRVLFIKTPLYWGVIILLLGTIIAASYFWNARSIDRHAYEMGVLRARLVFTMIQTTRSWIAGHGGVFAPDSPELSNLLVREGNLKIHLTSLKPINPANVADPWEALVLTQFESGLKEYVETVKQSTEEEFRYMAPLVVTQTCMQCHAHQGYKIGDIRGGIRISQPADHVYKVVATQQRTNLAVHVAAYGIIALLIWLSLATIRRYVLQLEVERDSRRLTAETLATKVQELETAQNELVQSEKMASLGRMVAGFAHEVNTPVGVAVGAVSHTLETLDATEALLANEEVTEEDLRKGFNTLREGSSLALTNLRRAADMVQSFKRTSVDQASDQNRDFDANQLVEDIFRSLHNTFKRTKIKLVNACPEKLALHGPAGTLVQILSNLSMNSFLHAFAEGSEAGTIRIEMIMLTPNRLQILYSDDGAGMNEDTLKHLFEPFFTTRRGKGGSGLGMYIVYNLMTQILRGEIQCESQLGKGMQCTMTFTITQLSKALTP